MHTCTECGVLRRRLLPTSPLRYNNLHNKVVPRIDSCQARFALTSAQVFSRTDLVTDSERFYTSILDLLDDPDEKDEVDQLLMWWNRYVLNRDAFDYVQDPVIHPRPLVCGMNVSHLFPFSPYHLDPWNSKRIALPSHI